METQDFYEVEITEANIDRYNMTVRFGETKEFLLERAEEASKQGYALSAKIPRDEVDAFNVFENFESEHVDPARVKACGYELREVENEDSIWVCIIHGKTSRHAVNAGSSLPCIQVDPSMKPTQEQIDTVLDELKANQDCRYDVQQHPIKGTIRVCILHGMESKFDVERLPNLPCLLVEPVTSAEGDPHRP